MSDVLTDFPLARRREAGGFLRSCRARLTPAKVGLQEGFRRRTPGLRREEVAMLAGVGTTWYTWLEQGRDIQPSIEVLSALARVLQLDSVERNHLFVLYDRPPPKYRPPCEEQLDLPLRRMLEGLGEQPAYVLGWRWDILAWNRAADLLLGPLARPGDRKPNAIELLFSDPAHRKLFVDWETVARGALAAFRADCAAYFGDPDLADLVARLSRFSREFAAWWPQQNVAHRMAGMKRLHHPVAGRMHFVFSTLAITDRPGAKLLVFTATDDENTPQKLRRLLDPTQ